MKILVIDDHPLFLDGLLQVLELMYDRVRPLQAASAEQAFALLEEAGELDMILVDFSLPGLDGVDFLRILRERGSSTPAVLISAHDDTAMVYDALECGASGFIPKSFRAAELLDALRRVNEGEIFVPSYMTARIGQFDRAAGSADRDRRAPGLTPRQCRIVELLGKGLSNRDIASALSVSEHTVKSHLKAIYSTLQINSRTQCIKRAEQLGIIGSGRDRQS